MPYKVLTWSEDGLWCAKTPDKDTFKRATLAEAVGEIFWRVTAAVCYVPAHLEGATTSGIGQYMLDNASTHDVIIISI